MNVVIILVFFQKLEGGEATLVCRPSKDTLTNKYPEITWFKNGGIMKPSQNLKFVKGGTEIRFRNLIKENQGN